MSDWVVVVKRKGDPNRKRIVVEGVTHEDEAEALALSKIGGDSDDHEAHAELIDDKVSVDDPNYNLKEMYDEVVDELAETRRIYQEAVQISTMLQERAEKSEVECNRLAEVNSLIHSKIGYIQVELNEIQKLFLNL